MGQKGWIAGRPVPHPVRMVILLQEMATKVLKTLVSVNTEPTKYRNLCRKSYHVVFLGTKK